MSPEDSHRLKQIESLLDALVRGAQGWRERNEEYVKYNEEVVKPLNERLTALLPKLEKLQNCPCVDVELEK